VRRSCADFRDVKGWEQCSEKQSCNNAVGEAKTVEKVVVGQRMLVADADARYWRFDE
jgi:hypothetical protein